MTTATNPSPMTSAAPGPERIPPAIWDAWGYAAYLLARHGRHDIVGLQCTVQVLEMVEKMQAQGQAANLPETMRPEVLLGRIKADIRKSTNMACDLLLLGQAPVRGAYAPIEPMLLVTLLDDAVFRRQAPGTVDEEVQQRLAESCGQARLLAYGPMLATAISTWAFQWTPYMLARSAVGGMQLALEPTCAKWRVALEPSSELESFLKLLAAQDDQAILASIRERAMSVPTIELAFWMARLIVQVHAGRVLLEDSADQVSMLIVELPLISQ